MPLPVWVQSHLIGRLRFVPGDPGVFPEEGSGLHEGHAHISPLEGGQQEVRPDVSESGRRQSVRPRGEEGAGGPDRRYPVSSLANALMGPDDLHLSNS